tara:strand:+ start:69 stop:266 length:198 start_codon:yes stop_codon:yes gene_type:complete
MVKKCKCKKKMYGYSDGQHEVWVCYNCGNFKGTAHGDEMFIDTIKSQPTIILAMIAEKMLVPMQE